jgi:glutathione synthase/RimK-type ligase-like ATP-grasp enzyme
MRIAIHKRDTEFTIRWIEYCKKHDIEFKLVDCYKNDIISQVGDCDALMWHHSQSNYKDILFAKQLLFSLQQTGKKVFPDFNTCWHFDDKVGQKYLLESIGAPLAPTYVFYTKEEALEWVKTTTFPKVFKLRGGAGSENVKLVRSATHACRLIRKAFRRGFPSFNRKGYLKERIRKFKEGKVSMLYVLKGVARLFYPVEFATMLARQKGYIYFQEFIPNNNYDIRVIVIGDKAFAIKRIVRMNDFRASGSGNIIYDKNSFSADIINLSFILCEKLQTQCVAFDFVYDSAGHPYVVEISYGFTMAGYDPCEGYWDHSLMFHEGTIFPQDWMVELLLKSE